MLFPDGRDKAYQVNAWLEFRYLRRFNVHDVLQDKTISNLNSECCLFEISRKSVYELYQTLQAWKYRNYLNYVCWFFFLHYVLYISKNIVEDSTVFIPSSH